MFNQQQQPAKPAFKFVIKSKIETSDPSSSTTNNKTVEEKSLDASVLDDRKRKRSMNEAPVAKKKIHSQLLKWNKKKEELKHEDSTLFEIEQAKSDFADLTSLSCLLCQRKFKSKPDLTRHQELSDLHKNNLKDPVAVNKAKLKLSFLKSEDEKKEEQTVEYRNRAAERRQAYGQPDRPVLSPPSSPPRQPSRELAALPKASMNIPIADDNKGARMLAQMGWKKGEGLGKDKSGILDPVKAESYAQTAGIGATSRRDLSTGDGSYRSRTLDVVKMTSNHLKPNHVTFENARPSEESEVFSLRDEDPLSLPSETLLNDNSTKERAEQQRKSIVKSSAINIFWILMWYMFATILSVYNKWMFSSDHYNFQYPLFVTSVHMIVQFAFSGTSLLLVPKLRPSKRPSVSDYLYKVLPCALATSLDIGLSNLSLKTITLSFYTMCKSSTLAFVLIFAFIFKLEKPNWKLILIIVIITAGVILMVSDETDFQLTGFIQVMAASVFGGLRWSLTEVLLRKESMGLTNPFASIFFLAPCQAIILLIISAIVEGYITIFNSAFFYTFGEGLHTIMIILAGGSLAFFMIMSEFFLIKRTSVVTLSVCGIFKEVATIFISSLVFGDILTIINIIGLCITLFGIALYNWLKLKMVASKARKDVRDQELDRVEGVEEEDYDSDDEHINRNSSHHLYSTVAESTPILLIDGGMSNYRDSEDDRHLLADDDDDDEERSGRHNRFEMR